MTRLTASLPDDLGRLLAKLDASPEPAPSDQEIAEEIAMARGAPPCRPAPRLNPGVLS